MSISLHGGRIAGGLGKGRTEQELHEETQKGSSAAKNPRPARSVKCVVAVCMYVCMYSTWRGQSIFSTFRHATVSPSHFDPSIHGPLSAHRLPPPPLLHIVLRQYIMEDCCYYCTMPCLPKTALSIAYPVPCLIQEWQVSEACIPCTYYI